MSFDIKKIEEIAKHKQFEEDTKQKELKIRHMKVTDQLSKVDKLDRFKRGNLSPVRTFDDIHRSQSERAGKLDKAVYGPTAAFKEFMLLPPGFISTIAAPSGNGKSTMVSNMAYYMAFSLKKKVMIIANEEDAESYTSRLACLYANLNIHKMHSQDYRSAMGDILRDAEYEVSKMIVIRDGSADLDEVRSVEGMESILNHMDKDISCLFIDYYQNINRSLKDTQLKEHECQAKFMDFLDNFKNTAQFPIVLMAQIRKDDGASDYEARMKGRKIIIDKSTGFYEMVIEKEQRRSVFKCHKDRWTNQVGEELFLGYSDGRLVAYTPDFQRAVMEERARMIDLSLGERTCEGDSE